MANYASSALLTAQTTIAKKYNEAELRRKRRPVIALALQNQEYSIPDAKRLRVAEQRAVEVHFKLAKAPGASTTKTLRHTGDKGDSSKLTLTWVRFTETFSISHKLMQNKLFGSQEVFNHEIEQAIHNLHDRAETAAVNYLYANRCQLAAPVTSGMGTWDNVGYKLSIAAGEKEYFTQNTKAFFYGRHHRGELDAICDLKLYNQLERTMAQGAGNQTNTGFQFGGIGYTPITDTILGSITTGQSLVMPKGQFACMPWNDQLNRQGYGRPNDYIGMFTILKDPFGLDCSYDVSVWSDRFDSNGIDGNVQDVQDQYEISLCVGFALPPLSLAGDSIIHHIVQA